MKALLTAVFLLLGVQNGLAEPVRVRSGEHDDFSRLVFPFAQPTDWVVKAAEGGYLVQFDRPDLDFDFSQVFRFIPTTRLSAIETGATPGSVYLSIDCPCHVDIFEIGVTRIVLDIKDGPSPGPAAKNAPRVEVKPEKKPTPSETASKASERLHAMSMRPASLKRPPAPVFGAFVELPTDIVKTTPPASVTADPDMLRMQDELLRKLGRAAAQGLVQIDLAEPQEPVPPSDADRDGEAARSEPAIDTGDDQKHLQAQTSVDRDTASLPLEPVTDQGDACVSAEEVRVEDWGAGHDPYDMIGLGRVSLVGEFDAVNADDLRRLVRNYIYLGFGAEARAVLRAFGLKLDDASLLSMMAEIVDKGAVAAPQSLKSQLGCNTPIALWAALAYEDLPKNVEINLNAVQIAFSALPLHLRRLLGPSLADRFLAAGQTEVAASLRNAISRAPGILGSEADLMQARADLEQGATAAAVSGLERIVARDDSIAPQALLDLFEVHRSTKTPMPVRDVEMADSMAFELRETRFAGALLRVSVLGSAMNESFEAAFGKWSRNGESEHLLNELVGMLAETPDDGIFVKYAFAAWSEITASNLPLDTKIAVAERMRSLGFPEEARVLFDDGTIAAADRDRNAWIERDWAQVAQSGSAEKRMFEQMRQEQTKHTPSSNAVPSLATARAVLSQSRRARGLLAELLSEPGNPGASSD